MRDYENIDYEKNIDESHFQSQPKLSLRDKGERNSRNIMGRQSKSNSYSQEQRVKSMVDQRDNEPYN